ncbi:MAG TPA: NAD(P)H-dependent oxidoreductase [Patescibacteria group bacterium]|nr:NAD(P)H-dependent oxidoreductase [Patescibacteria group bacterium]
MDGKIKILAIAGSLRKGSYNMASLRAARDLAPEEMKIEIFEKLREIPPFNQDEENNPPEAVRELKEKIKAADAILFATPEYNYSVPGVLKNAIDWASRPYGQNAWEGKPVAILGASIGNIGTARAQYHLRQSFVFLDMHALNRPEVMISNAEEKFGAKGDITDEHTREKIRELLEALAKWVKKF